MSARASAKVETTREAPTSFNCSAAEVELPVSPQRPTTIGSSGELGSQPPDQVSGQRRSLGRQVRDDHECGRMLGHPLERPATTSRCP